MIVSPPEAVNMGAPSSHKTLLISVLATCPDTNEDLYEADATAFVASTARQTRSCRCAHLKTTAETLSSETRTGVLAQGQDHCISV